MKVCRKCGALIRDTDRRCRKCGAKVPGAGAAARKKKKEDRKIHFQSAPSGRHGDLDSFEEYEDRSGALRMTVRVLVIITVMTAAVALLYAWRNNKWMFRQPSQDEESAIVIQSEEAEAGIIESELKVQFEPAEDAGQTADTADGAAQEEQN